ncbi:unnamed protein product [Meganyctiphanes norvegica]|uniref:Cuticle protein n=1 Tax=Meganyctiphanes norvegica TaxID=48144 RepID=A0AAV2SRL1_MEGNR
MIGKNIFKLVVGVLLFGTVMAQQPGGSVLGGQPIQPRPLQPRPLQPSRPLSALQSRPAAQQQAFSPISQPQRFISEQAQGPQVPIVEDIRDGPFHDGSYYFGYVSDDGSVREEGAVPTGDGSFIITGSYSYTAPNGEVIAMEYIADANGYRAFPKGSRPEFTPPQRVLNAPPLPATSFVDEFNPGQIRPLLNQQRPQAFRPVSNNLNNQVNRPFNRPVGIVNRPALGANRIGDNTVSGSAPAVTLGLADTEGSFSNQINVIADPLQENIISGPILENNL